MKHKTGLRELEKQQEKLSKDVHARLMALSRKGFRLAIGESFTGGELTSTLVRNSGSSRYLLGSIVFYNPNVKIGIGIPKMVAKKIPVSARCARTGTQSLIRFFSERFHIKPSMAVVTTGFAGPGKHAGLFYIGIAAGDKSESHRFVVHETGSNRMKRHKIRLHGVIEALELLKVKLEDWH